MVLKAVKQSQMSFQHIEWATHLSLNAVICLQVTHVLWMNLICCI